MQQKNRSSNGLLNDTCRHMRNIRDYYYSSYHLSGIVIDSFVYTAMGNWQWMAPGESSSAAQGDYEAFLLDYFNQHNYWGQLTLSAPGSNQVVSVSDSITGLSKVLNHMAR